MELRIQLIAIIASTLLLVAVLELVRRKAFLERYALLWLLSALVMLGLSLAKGLLESVSAFLGIAYPPNALFLVAFGFVLVLLLHFSLAVSRLSDQAKVLAQRMALLEHRQREADERVSRAAEGSSLENPAVAPRFEEARGRELSFSPRNNS
jgi:hypothetical protein